MKRPKVIPAEVLYYADPEKSTPVQLRKLEVGQGVVFPIEEFSETSVRCAANRLKVMEAASLPVRVNRADGTITVVRVS